MKIALLNSRKPRRFGPDEPWLRSTLRLGYEIARQGHVLCTSVGTIGYECALFGAAMGGGSIEAFVSPDAASSVMDCLPPKTASDERLSIRFLSSDSAEQPNAEVARDRAVMDAADLVIAVAIRAGGHMESLLRARFDQGKLVQVAAPWDDGPLTRGNRRLAESGVPHIDPSLLHALQDQESFVEVEHRPWDSFFPEWKTSRLSGPTLAHFTRAAEGPWPEQTRGEYLEDLWYGGMRARRDGEAALRRILTMGTLRASSRLIRGGHAVVSLTAAAPERIGELYRYRPHLVRWDFEPWGMVFDRDWLVKQGARPVHYLPGSSFRTLSTDERPWFQKHEPPGCDYSMEEEWRVLGDLNFADAPRDVVRIVAGG